MNKQLVFANRKGCKDMENIIVLAVVGLIVGFAAGYIYKKKKQGVKCIGCPDSKTCGGNCGHCGGCGSVREE